MICTINKHAGTGGGTSSTGTRSGGTTSTGTKGGGK
jgi:hypothetical protein